MFSLQAKVSSRIFPLLLLVPTLATAHHSTLGFFNRARTVEVEGVIKAVQWRNPHTVFEFDVQNAEGELVQWHIESGVYRHGFLGQPGECIHAAVVSANARRTTAGARKPSRSINHCWL